MNKSRSLQVYKFIVDSSWYIGLAVCAIWFLTNIYMLIFEGKIQGGNLVDFPLEFKVPKVDIKGLNSTYDFIVNSPATIHAEIETIKSSQLFNLFASMYLLSLVIGAIITFLELWFLKKLISDVVKGDIFTKQNATRLKYIGLLELISIPVAILFYVIMSNVAEDHAIFGANFKYVPDYTELFYALPHGLEYLIFAGIFAFGYKLKQESDLTI